MQRSQDVAEGGGVDEEEEAEAGVCGILSSGHVQKGSN